MTKQKFGTKGFFKNYLLNQIEKEGTQHEVVSRVNYAMSSVIHESSKGKDAYKMLLNLHEACEEVSKMKGLI